MNTLGSVTGASMNTDYLREFVVFAGHMNFTAAARTLNVSQPTLSRHISELERHYRCELVDRSTPLLRLTYCGKVLLEQAPELIAVECSLEAGMADARREPYGRLIVERYRKSPLIRGLLSDVRGALRAKHPGFSIVQQALRPGDSAGEAVLRGDIDVGIVACTTDGEPTCPVRDVEGLACLRLASREHLRFVVAADSPLADRASLYLADLAEFCFVFPLNPEFGRCRPDVERLFAERGLTLRSRPYELGEVEELGLMDIGPGEVFIVVESAADAPDTFYLRNSSLRIISCAEPILVTRFVIFRANDDNPVLAVFLEEVTRLDAAQAAGQT